VIDAFYHIAAYNQSQAAGAANDQLTAVSDAALTTQNSNFILPQQMALVGVYAGGVGINRVRLNTPKFRNPGLPTFYPVSLTREPPSSPPFVDRTHNPLFLDRVDELQMETSNTDVGAQTHTVIVFLQSQFVPVPAEPSYNLRGTATVTTVDGSWASAQISMEQSLPNGSYLITGLTVIGANGIAARLIIPGTRYRPGVLCQTAVGNLPHPAFEEKRLGCLGSFENINIPQLEVFADGAAATAFEVYLDVIRRGPAA
jgi:hypothetical protein